MRQELIKHLMAHEEYLYHKLELINNQIKANLSTVKKGYASTLGALAIAATGGITTPFVAGYLNFSVNAGGWYLATEGMKDFVGAAIDMSHQKDLSYWCALGQQAIDKTGTDELLKGAFFSGSLASGIGFAAQNLSGPVGKGVTLVGVGAIGYFGYEGLISAPGESAEQLEKLKKKLPHEKKCIDLAIKKVRSGQVVDIVGLTLALGGYGQAGIKTARTHPKSPIKKYLDQIEEKKSF